jgi:dCTP deaminase
LGSQKGALSKRTYESHGVILTDREIKNSIASGLIDISPPPGANAYSSTSIDLTLDRRIRIFKKMAHRTTVTVDPSIEGYKVKQLLDDATDPYDIPEEGYDLTPHKLVLGWTIERVELRIQGRVAGLVEGQRRE